MSAADSVLRITSPEELIDSAEKFVGVVVRTTCPDELIDSAEKLAGVVDNVTCPEELIDNVLRLAGESTTAIASVVTAEVFHRFTSTGIGTVEYIAFQYCELTTSNSCHTGR